MRPVAAVLVALFGCLPLAHRPLAGQISTDRPDFVEASTTVPRGSMQVETSLALTREEPGLDAWTTPTLVRVGLPGSLEARIESEWLVHVAPEDASTTTGLGDIALGLKWHAHPGEAGTADPSVGLLLHVDLPTHTHEAVGSDGVRPSLRAVGEWELPAGFALGVMPGVILERDPAGERFTAGILGVVVARKWTERVRTFAESAWERIAAAENGGNVGSWDFGATLLLGPELQLDGAVAFGATDGSADVAFTLGLSALVGS